ncbi:transposase [Acidovorax sacchari]|uniref:transposase n=1 Tax=Acidovorax sacchari TaxID=3230736 RepID=UPI0039E5611C
MELVTGIDWRNGKALALTSSSEGGTKLIEPAAMANRGLPKPQTYARHITFNLQDLQAASFSEYAEAFGLKLDPEPRHSAWSLQLGRSRLVIPALALLRAFVRPNQILLPQLFKAQSLDDICFLADQGSSSYVQVRGNLGNIRYTRESTYMGPLSWFFCFPSARQSWASVYQAAKAGHLHFELPSVRATVASRHHRVGLDCYITTLSLVQFEALEDPADFAIGHPRSFVTSAHTRALKRPAVEATDYETGRALSDEEWDALRPILVRTDHGRRYETCRNRVLLNCILQKLSTDISWRDLAALHGVLPTTVASALARWRADGRLDLVMEQLPKLRTPPGELTSGPLPGHEEVVTSKAPCP